MDHIKTKHGTIDLSFDIQVGKMDRPFRLSGLRKNLQLPTKWIEKKEKNHWIYSFRYMDQQGGFFEVEIGYYDEYIEIRKKITT